MTENISHIKISSKSPQNNNVRVREANWNVFSDQKKSKQKTYCSSKKNQRVTGKEILSRQRDLDSSFNVRSTIEVLTNKLMKLRETAGKKPWFIKR